MDSIFDTEKSRLSDRALFSKIWTTPARVFRYLEDHQYEKFTILLIVVRAIVSMVHDQLVVILYSTNPSQRLGTALGITIGNCLVCYIYAALIAWTGRWLGNHASFKSLVRVVAFSQLPALCCLLLSILLKYITLDFTLPPEISPGFLRTLGIFIIAAGNIWTFVLQVIGVRELQQLPIGKAALNVLITYVILAIPVMIRYFLLT